MEKGKCVVVSVEHVLTERERRLAGLLRCLVQASKYGPVDVGTFIHSFREYLYGSFVPPERQKPWKQFRCLNCGVEFFAEEADRMFCSASCAAAWNSKNRARKRA